VNDVWVALALALVLALTLGFFLAVGAFMLLNHSESIESITKAHEKSVSDLMEQHVAVVTKLVDGPKLPEVPQMMEVKAADEEWIASPESIITQGDDLSPVFDPDEV
jgi:hypothetical protein